jgi:hypothetical protein
MPPPNGRARLIGRSFADDRGPFLAVTATMMSALRLEEADATLLDADLAHCQRHGVDAIRWLTMVSWPGRAIDPTRAGHVERCAAMVDRIYDRFGMRSQVTVFADCREIPAMRQQKARLDYATRLASALKGREHKILFVETCNEPGHAINWAEVGTTPELIEATRLIKAQLGTLVACGAPFGDPNGATAWTPENMKLLGDNADLVVPHYPRARDGHEGPWKIVRQPLSVLGPYPVHNNEPAGPGSSVEELVAPNLQRVACTTTWMAGNAGYCWHTGGGVGEDAQEDVPLAGEPGLPTLAAARALLPADLVAAFTVHDAKSAQCPVEMVDGSLTDCDTLVARGTVATVTATAGARVIVYPFGIPCGATLRARRAMQLARHTWNGQAYAEVEKLKVKAGETITVPPADDHVYVGRLT